MDWFRSHHGAPTDPKWLLIAKRANVRPIHVIGTWWALLDYASQHSDRGSIDGFDTETFALFAGLEDEHVSRIVTTLRDKGLIADDRIAQWGKRQPKKEDDTAAERKRRSRDNKPKNGGNPPPGGSADTAHVSTDGERHAMSRDVTLDTDKIREESSVANATGTVVPLSAAAFCKAVFDSAIPLLIAADPTRTERDARSVIGRWRKTTGDADLLTLIREATDKSEPLEWLCAAVETRNGRKSNSGTHSGRRSGLVDALRSANAECEAERAAYYQDDGAGAWLALPSVGG
jgi:hypothetical protein